MKKGAGVTPGYEKMKATPRITTATTTTAILKSAFRTS